LGDGVSRDPADLAPHPRCEDDRWARWPLVRRNLSLTLSLRARARRRGRRERSGYDALFFHTQATALFSIGLARWLPVIVSVDAGKGALAPAASLSLLPFRPVRQLPKRRRCQHSLAPRLTRGLALHPDSVATLAPFDLIKDPATRRRESRHFAGPPQAAQARDCCLG
jgi:hypothetical protein